jgi:Tfp pilus assembly protein PilZ
VSAPEAAEDFEALLNDLEDLEQRRFETNGRLSPAEKERRQQIERRLRELLVQPARRQFIRVSCDLPVWVHVQGKQRRGIVGDLGTGGVFVITPMPARVGEPVSLEIEPQPGSLAYGLRVHGTVGWIAETAEVGSLGLGVAFTENDPATDRTLQRFLVELLRKRFPREVG